MKEKLTCYIIDDEPLAQEILQEYISKVPFLQLQASFANPLEASAEIANDNPELIFLDINMPDLDGLSFIPMLNPKPAIILTTAYDQFALKAYELEVNDYLLKPFSFERFYKSVLRVYQSLKSRPGPDKKDLVNTVQLDREYVFLKVGHRIQKIALKDILYIEAVKDYLRLYTEKEQVMTLLSFAELEEQLSSKNFTRVHRSFMVAIDKIDHIEKNRIRIGNQIIPISNTYAEVFFRMLNG